MKQDSDLYFIRVFPYALSGTLIVIPLLAILAVIWTGISAGKGGWISGEVISFAGIFIYIFQVAVLACLYRMRWETEDFRRAQTVFVAWFLLNLLSQLVLWFRGSAGGYGPGRYISITLFLLKDIVLMAGILFVLFGMEKLCREMAEEKEMEGIIRLRKKWIYIQSVRLSFLGICYFLIPAAGKAGAWKGKADSAFFSVFPVVFIAGFLILFVGYVFYGIRLFIKLLEICQSYHRYVYNRSLGL